MRPGLVAGGVVAGVLIVIATGLYWKGRLEGAAAERPKVAEAQAQAAVSGLEARGERESVARVGAAARTRDAAHRSVIRVAEEATKSEDADVPLDSDRLSRLRAHDEQLCQAAPALAGCAPPGDARGGAPPLRTAPAPGKRDDGGA